ncbi:MAG TPA: NUDIX domain-containing protein [Pirellulales bacterium]
MRTGTGARRRGAVAVIPRDGKLLVIRRSIHVPAPRAFCFPGGGVETGETDAEAAVREVQEELALPIRAVRPVWRCTSPWKVELVWWLSEAVAGVEPIPNPAEVESCHWYTVEETLKLENLLSSNRGFLHAVLKGTVSLEL